MTDFTTSEKKAMKNAKPAGTILDGRYELKAFVGYGGFSIVYDAVNIHTDQRVAVKECTQEELREKFLVEARLLSDFSQEPSIVSVIDYFESDSTAYIVMEYLEGKTLRSAIKEDGAWSMEDTVKNLSPIMETLERMNSKGVIHRDISPDNIMILNDGSMKLLDFGAAREFEKVTVSKLVYKPNYSPPEQVDEKGNMGAWSDVYSMCATMYYCITATNPEDVISRVLFDEIETPAYLGADILPGAEKTLMKGLSLEIGSRIHDMGTLIEELKKSYPLLTEEEKQVIAEKRARRKKFATRIATGVFTAVLLVFAIMGIKSIVYNLTQCKVVFMPQEGYEKISQRDYEQATEVLSNRLDAIGIEYTIRETSFPADNITIMLHSDEVGKEVLNYLGYSFTTILGWGLGSELRAEDLYVLGFDDPKVQVNDNGDYKIRLKIDNSSEGSQVALEFLRKMQERGDEYVYLNYGAIDILRIEVEKAIQMLNDDGEIIFDEWLTTGSGWKYIPQFCNFIVAESNDQGLPACINTSPDIRSVLPFGKSPTSNSPDIFKSIKDGTDYVKKTEKKYNDEIKMAFALLGTGEKRTLNVFIDNKDMTQEQLIKRAGEFYQEESDNIKEAGFGLFNIWIWGSDMEYRDEIEFSIDANEEGYVMAEGWDVASSLEIAKEDSILKNVPLWEDPS